MTTYSNVFNKAEIPDGWEFETKLEMNAITCAYICKDEPGGTKELGELLIIILNELDSYRKYMKAK